MQIWKRRIYDKPTKQDGTRILIDRIWPRGVSKEDARLDAWLKEIAPSTELRKWFDHDPNKWNRFKRSYFTELDNKDEALEKLEKIADGGRVTLVYSAKDTERNNAVALKEYIQKKWDM